jgi:hypothetical protein
MDRYLDFASPPPPGAGQIGGYVPVQYDNPAGTPYLYRFSHLAHLEARPKFGGGTRPAPASSHR